MAVRRRIRSPKRRRKKFTRGMTITLFLFLVFVFILFIVLLGRIYFLNRDHGDTYKKRVFSQQSYTNTILKFRRGAIKDRNETILAQSVRRFNMVIEPRTLLKDPDPEVKTETFAKLTQYFAIDANKLDQLVSDNPESMYLHVEGQKELKKEQITGFTEEMDKNKKVKDNIFSKGEKQLLAFARAIAKETSVYIFDELRCNKMSNEKTWKMLQEKGVTNSDLITADSAENKSIGDYKTYGAFNPAASNAARVFSSMESIFLLTSTTSLNPYPNFSTTATL